MKVLLTGGSGYLGKHCLTTLLEHGHSVVSTVRSQRKAEQLQLEYAAFSSRLSFSIVEDIAQPGAFDETLNANSSFDAVVHTASPFHYKAKNAKEDMIDPAVSGTTEILRAVKRWTPSVKRIVITSSFAAVVNMQEQVPLYKEDTWNPITMEQALSGGVAAYVGSKKFAEEAAWSFMDKEKPDFILSTINPVMIFGPVSDHLTSLSNINTSNEVFSDLIQGKWRTEIPPNSFQFVDVRDVALAHIRAIEVEAAAASGRRFLAAAGPYNNHQLAQIVQKEFPQLSSQLPNEIKAENIEGFSIDTTAIKEILGIQFRSLKETVVDTVKSLLQIEGA